MTQANEYEFLGFIHNEFVFSCYGEYELCLEIVKLIRCDIFVSFVNIT